MKFDADGSNSNNTNNSNLSISMQTIEQGPLENQEEIHPYTRNYILTLFAIYGFLKVGTTLVDL